MVLKFQRWLARMPTRYEEGTVTAEFAMVLPSVIVVAALVLALGRLVAVSVDCNSAASAAARELIVTGSESAARNIAAQVAESSVTVTIHQAGRLRHIQVTCPLLPGPMGLTPASVPGRATVVMQ
ncbi:pilus assembly protein [Bifidobacterium sp. LC6]|uniref:Pilus assembly protein n=1 Tax=Bifidobacterium colobi TaxID=2809026 RepID=A0ABS5UTB1_9BIFI|nr:TadE family protein [Bifidobacterium colobi]MBT1174224.1 pilus assembly protein [Bifidobacterium colobi]